MKEILKALKKNWIKLWLVIAIIAFTGIVSYAAYTRVNIVKRVISTDEGVGDKFSSDYMKSTGITISIEPISSTDRAPEVHVHVFNYPYPKSAFYRNSETSYTLTARLGTLSGTTFSILNPASMTQEEIALLNDGGYKIKYNNGTEQTFSTSVLTHEFGNCVINGGSALSDDFTLTFDISEVTSATPNGYVMELVAVPDDSELPILTGYVSVKYVTMANSGWSGVLETPATNKSYADYDGFNYILSGTGKGEIEFKWKPDFVSINKQFLENKSIKFKINGTTMMGGSGVSTAVSQLSPDTDGYISIALVVDSVKVNRYIIQFFKTGNDEADYSGSLGIYIPATTESDWKPYTDS